MIASVKAVVESASPPSPTTSRVSFPCSRVTSRPFSIAEAASNSPRWRSSITPERMSAVGLMTFLPAYFGAEPCTASKIATSEPRFADGAKPRPPTSAEERSLRMSPFMFVITITSNCSGRLTSWCAQLSTMMCCASMSGYSGAIVFERALERPLGELHDVRLRGAVDRLAPLGAGELEGEPDDLLAALARDQLEALRHARRLHVLDARVEVLDVLAHDTRSMPRPEYGVTMPGSSRAGRMLPYVSNSLRSVTFALFSPKPTGVSSGPLSTTRVFADRLDRLVRNAGGETLHEHARARLRSLPLDRRARRLDDPARRVDDLRADAVARDERDLPHASPPGRARRPTACEPPSSPNGATARRRMSQSARWSSSGRRSMAAGGSVIARSARRRSWSPAGVSTRAFTRRS